ncbi:hypothetical protein [Parazoarcus communis]|uniref:hypothetical protein n=1 Tax=Parazoarcus communis TaxID=41977 RepID=UPI00131F086E|nr:hypothetical protein [Parazoarcus communis]
MFLANKVENVAIKLKAPRHLVGAFSFTWIYSYLPPICAWIAVRGRPSALGDIGDWLVIGLTRRWSGARNQAAMRRLPVAHLRGDDERQLLHSVSGD